MKQLSVLFKLSFVLLLQTSYSFAGNNFKQDKGFIENRGQFISTSGKLCEELLFKSCTPGLDIYLTKKGISYVYSKIETPKTHKMQIFDIDSTNIKVSLYRMDMQLEGANPEAKVIPENQIDTYYNFYQGHCKNGIVNIKSYSKVIYKDIYPFIDWVIYYSENNILKYDFIVHPNGNPSDIKFKYLSADSLNKKNKSLCVTNRLGYLVDGELLVYQNNKNVIKGDFKLSNKIAQFNIGNYDKTIDLVIDPYITWSTYFGGALDEQNGSLKIDLNQNIIISGSTYSTNFPVLGFSNAFNDSIQNGNIDLFYSKFTNGGVQKWTTYYGGSKNEDLEYLGNSLDIDSLGNIYATGTTYSADFPTQSIAGGFFQKTLNGPKDAFILKFNSSGKRVFASYLGGSNNEIGTVVKIAPGGRIFLLGCTWSSDFVRQSLANAYNQNAMAGVNNAYICRLNPDLSLNWSTYLGGASGNFFSDMTFDNLGHFFLAGNGDYYGGTNIPLVDLGNGAYFQSTPKALIDGIIVRFNNNPNIDWCTYFGGVGNSTPSSGYDGFVNIIFNKYDGTLYATSQAAPSDYPILAKSGAYNKPNCQGPRDIGIIQFSTNGVLLWCTYFGGTEPTSSNQWDTPTGMEISQDGKLWITGTTNTIDVPTISDGTYFKPYNSGNRETLLIRFSISGELEYSTYFGGANDDYANNIHTNFDIDMDGNFFLTGVTNSNCTTITSGFPLFDPLNSTYFQNSIAGGHDAFITKFSSNPATGTSNICSSAFQNNCGNTFNLAINGSTPYTCGYQSTLTLTGIPSGGYFSGVGMTNNIFSSKEAGEGIHEIKYNYKNAFGCADSTSISIKVEYELTTPNVFTPNGDYHNDTLIFRGLQNGASLIIQNRWGATIYENDNYDNTWNGGNAPDGLYFYSIKKNGECNPKVSGYIQLIR